MNPIRPLLRASVRSSLVARSHLGVARRTLVTPSNPVQATVSEVVVDRSAREDPGEFEEGEVVAGEHASGEG